MARAVACERRRGRASSAERWLATLKEPQRTAVTNAAAKVDPAKAEAANGDVVVSATWDGGADLDVVLVDPAGRRAGVATRMKGRASRARRLAITRPSRSRRARPARSWSRWSGAAGEGRDVPITGKLTIRAFGQTQTVPFTLTGARAQVARVESRWEAELVRSRATNSGFLHFNGARPFDRGAAAGALARVSVATLRGERSGRHGPRDRGVPPVGPVSGVVVDDPSFSGTPAGRCVTAAFFRPSVPPFEGAPVRVGKSFTIGTPIAHDRDRCRPRAPPRAARRRRFATDSSASMTRARSARGTFSRSPPKAGLRPCPPRAAARLPREGEPDIGSDARRPDPFWRAIRPGALEPGKVPARGRRIHPEQRRERRGGQRAALRNQLQCLGLLRSHVARTRTFACNASETTYKSKKGARKPVLVGHGKRPCSLQVLVPRQASSLPARAIERQDGDMSRPSRIASESVSSRARRVADRTGTGAARSAAGVFFFALRPKKRRHGVAPRNCALACAAKPAPYVPAWLTASRGPKRPHHVHHSRISCRIPLDRAGSSASKRPETCRMFESDLLERFSRIHPITISSSGCPSHRASSTGAGRGTSSRSSRPRARARRAARLDALRVRAAPLGLPLDRRHPARKPHPFPPSRRAPRLPDGQRSARDAARREHPARPRRSTRSSAPSPRSRSSSGFTVGYLAYDGTHYAVHHFKRRRASASGSSATTWCTTTRRRRALGCVVAAVGLGVRDDAHGEEAGRRTARAARLGVVAGRFSRDCAFRAPCARRQVRGEHNSMHDPTLSVA